MNYSKQIYAEQVRSLISNYSISILTGEWTPENIAIDYEEVGENMDLTINEAVEIIEQEIARYKNDRQYAYDKSGNLIQ